MKVKYFEKSKMKKALKELKKNGKKPILTKIKNIKKESRIKFLVKQYSEIMELDNRNKNWLLWRINQIVDIDLCPFFRLGDNNKKQFCVPLYDSEEYSELIKIMERKDRYYSLRRVETNCNLLKYKNCPKKKILS